MNITVKVANVQKLSLEMRAAVHQGTINGLEKVGARGSVLVQDNIVSPYNGLRPAVATGNLAAHVFWNVMPGVGVMTATIGEGAPSDTYVAPVETGTKPHMPPPSALLPWVKLKFNPDSEKEAMSIAFAVAKSIAKRGTQGHFMFQRAGKQLVLEAGPIMEREIAEALLAAGYASEGG